MPSRRASSINKKMITPVAMFSAEMIPIIIIKLLGYFGLSGVCFRFSLFIFSMYLL